MNPPALRHASPAPAHERPAPSRRVSRSPSAQSPAAPVPSTWLHLATRIQPKLRVGSASDPAERDADRMAERVVGIPDQVIQRQCADCAGKTAACPECEEQDPSRLHRKARSEEGRTSVPDGLRQQLGPGDELDPATRGFFEPRFGTALGQVRIHTGREAQAAAESLQARAFTLGDHVAFAEGEYAPETHAGRRLLAHELAHVVQAGSTGNTVAAASDGPVRRSAVESGVEPAYGEGHVPESPPGISGEDLPWEAPAGSAVPEPETCPPPESMDCGRSSSAPGTVAHAFIFPVNSADLNSAQIAEIDAVASAWHTAGGRGALRVDGYASAEGACDHNWDLSCRRAKAVKEALGNPSTGASGVPAGSVGAIAHGESNAFGTALEQNRRATISVPVPPPPAPRPTPPPAPTCTFPFSLGSGRGCGGGPDFTHFDFPSISATSEARLAAWAAVQHPMHLPFRSGVPTLTCMAEMDAVLVGLAGVAGHAAFLRFVAGTGGTATHGLFSILGLMARFCPSFLATVRTVQTDIETQLASQASGGTLDPCALSVTPPQTHFGFLDGPPLKAVIGGTQGEEVIATSFSGNVALRTYTMGLEFVICDDFGVDETDLYAPGLFAFWVLQHERSPSLFAPFVNELRLPVTISGTF